MLFLVHIFSKDGIYLSFTCHFHLSLVTGSRRVEARDREGVLSVPLRGEYHAGEGESLGSLNTVRRGQHWHSSFGVNYYERSLFFFCVIRQPQGTLGLCNFVFVVTTITPFYCTRNGIT